MSFDDRGRARTRFKKNLVAYTDSSIEGHSTPLDENPLVNSQEAELHFDRDLCRDGLAIRTQSRLETPGFYRFSGFLL
jgi:hypothetical protein